MNPGVPGACLGMHRDTPYPTCCFRFAMTAKLDRYRKKRDFSRTGEPSGDTLQNLNRDQLYEQAKDRKIAGRSKMTRQELVGTLKERRLSRAAALPLSAPGKSYKQVGKSVQNVLTSLHTTAKIGPPPAPDRISNLLIDSAKASPSFCVLQSVHSPPVGSNFAPVSAQHSRKL